MFNVTYKDSAQHLTFTVKALTETTRVSVGFCTESVYTVLQSLKDTVANNTLTLPQLKRIESKLKRVDSQDSYSVIGEDFSVTFEKVG